MADLAPPVVMVGVRIFFAFVLCCSVRVFAATAPDAIGGKVYRESFIVASTRTSAEKTIVFGTDGRCTYLKSGSGNALVLGLPFRIFLNAPHADGTFAYARTGDATATVN